MQVSQTVELIREERASFKLETERLSQVRRRRSCEDWEQNVPKKRNSKHRGCGVRDLGGPEKKARRPEWLARTKHMFEF